MVSAPRHVRLLTGSLAAIAMILWAGATCGAELFGQPDQQGYQMWLHSLQRTVKAQQNASGSEYHLLYPFDMQPPLADETQAWRHLSISRALRKLEGDAHASQRVRGASTFQAVSLARSYWGLSEYDSALVWYERAAHRDTSSDYLGDIGRESLAAAVALGDSLLITQTVLNTIGTSELEGRGDELILAYRYLLTHMDTHELELLVSKLDNVTWEMKPLLRFWHAFALVSLERWEPALQQLKQLLGGGGLSQGLNRWQRCWVLTTVPDLLFQLNQASAARPLYEQLAASELPEIQGWAIYQLGNLDFVSMNYARARVSYTRLCAETGALPWQERACALARLAEIMSDIKTEGEAYGRAASYRP
jgi:tetratricopeptide (TPR) repeat protein